MSFPGSPMIPVAQLPKGHLQQFYLHKLFDLESDAQFLPLIPQDPVAAAIHFHETSQAHAQLAMASPAMQRPEMFVPYTVPHPRMSRSAHFYNVYRGRR